MRSSDVSFSPKTSLQPNFLFLLKDATEQSKELKKVFEEYTKKVLAMTEDYEMKSQGKENSLAQEILQVTSVYLLVHLYNMDSTNQL